MTNAPPVINLYETLTCLNTPHDFNNRFNGEPDYFSAKGEQKGSWLVTNFVADVSTAADQRRERGAGGGHPLQHGQRLDEQPHLPVPDRTYKKGHAHGPGAHVIILSGQGYSLMWPEGDEPRRYDWEVGTLTPPNRLHQHFNTGTTPARYLAPANEVVSIRNAQGVPKA